jgi:hypothetical protein
VAATDAENAPASETLEIIEPGEQGKTELEKAAEIALERRKKARGQG